MRVVALISGGKDSTYNMMQCVAAGHQIVALANLKPADNEGVSDELDSYMYQTVGHQAIDLYAEAMGLPLYRRTIEGSSVDTGRVYTKCDGDEVEDLYQLLKHVQIVLLLVRKDDRVGFSRLKGRRHKVYATPLNYLQHPRVHQDKTPTLYEME